ncbi:hypothetical protein SPRG_01076 [Saprolegnia parasitica CBS 223.65]|uniref:BZIP domain-containing protein n=1 Tax=Saprolegnia parasitica (strain CBS 223.65) TaxID=695850 RepID=A0A067CWW8_SAPPC|nr:hypothetical protein SPRG_01076 [Saprolegnia parasitica CBS 223.65]KDO35013.1 hypothetical protein SPRG_01076 [Saprolegnia parasitica CBS 223.65]|eukprot:XP_012194666.1 hypothetical protein SPRG_01076 [Saprolegnia parasitica CBS 223.65]
MAGLNLDQLTMELLPEDDDLLSYFLSSDVATEERIGDLSLNPSGVAMDHAALGRSDAGSASAYGYGSSIHGDQPSSFRSHHPSSNLDTASTASGDFDGPDSPTGGDNDLDTDDDKRQRRLARNRESARQSRRRKKQYLELLEEKVAQLTEEIDATRGEHLESADKTLSTLKSQMVASLYEKLSSLPPMASLGPELTDELRSGVKIMQERYGPHSEERRAVVNYHFQQLDNLLLPPYTRFLLWMSIQDEAFFSKIQPAVAAATKKSSESDRKDSSAKKDTLWAALSSELGMTYEQEEKIKSHYKSTDSKTAKAERRKIAMAVTYLNQLKQNMEERSAAVQTHANAITSILTPEQSVRYQQWVQQNRETYRASLKEKSVHFANAPTVDPEGKISTILRKPDQDLTVEDVTVLLSTLSKQHATQQDA